MANAGTPIADLKVGDTVIGPFGVYEFRVTEITAEQVIGVYTHVRPTGYPLGDRAVYLLSDWREGYFFYAP